MTDNFKSVLENILKKDKRLVDDSEELNGNRIHEYVSSLDEGLIELLLNEEATREKFFLKVKDVYVFKQNDFKFFLDENKIDNSYTQYANRIGLSTGGKFLKDIDDVVLDFPYKDCVLEGGQSTEEGTDTYFEYDENEQDYIEKEAKRKEIFFNQILAKDEIDRLTEPKAFTNIKRYTEKGEEKITSFNRNEKGKITDNLIIKGNNLLALHSLQEQFQGKVKLIYIDPPYNTGNDEFKYNDKFNHSAWLTFMKNRLEEAKKLLHPEGLIAIQCDDNENAYLKLLMDSIFKRKNFLNNVAVKMSEASGVKMNHAKGRFPKLKEYILIYRMPSFKGFVTVDKYRQNVWDSENNILLENLTEKQRNELIEIEAKEINEPADAELANKILSKVKKISLSQIIKKLKLEGDDLDEWLFENSYRIIKTAGSSSLSKLAKSLKNTPDQDIAAAVSNKGILFFYITDFNRNTKQPRLQVIFADSNIFKNPCDFWQDIKTTGAISDEGGVKLSNGKKPEKVLYRLIKMVTNENELVLDYHLGSGTTVAVAHKMNRRYIGVEQLDYGKNDSVERLKNVIKGDKTGVSEFDDVNWKGGGSFVYCELAKNNQKAIDKIMSCKSLEELITFFDELYEKYFLNYNVNVREFKEKIVNEPEFKKLKLDRQKEIFARMLDLNQLYVNVSDMEDSRFKLSDEDISLTKNFYQL